MGSVVSKFSVFHVLPSIEMLMELKMSVVGCAYLYDNITKGCSWVDTKDIVMKLVSPNTGTVKWGSDSEYSEHPIYSTDLSDYATVMWEVYLILLTAKPMDSTVAYECMDKCSKVLTFKCC